MPSIQLINITGTQVVSKTDVNIYVGQLNRVNGSTYIVTEGTNVISIIKKINLISNNIVYQSDTETLLLFGQEGGVAIDRSDVNVFKLGGLHTFTPSEEQLIAMTSFANNVYETIEPN